MPEQEIIIGAEVINDEGSIQKDRETSRKIENDIFENDYEEGNLIEPPYDFFALTAMAESSNILPQCVETMEQNCEGFGYNFVPIVPEEEQKKLESQMKEEKDFLDNFFQYANYDMSFTKLRKNVRKDIETIGNGYMEVLRNEKNELSGFEYIKGITVRLGQLSNLINIEIKKKEVGSYEYEKVRYRKRFRTYCQKINEQKVYFKEYGDPRHIDSATGKEVSEDDVKSAKVDDGEIILATELLHFLIENPSSDYGITRWIGNTLSVLGSRSMEFVNHSYFDNQAMGPVAILVSGGTMAKGAEKKIKDYFASHKSKSNFHKVLILQAQGANNPNSMDTTSVKIEIKELSKIDDAIFQKYDDKNRNKVRSSFRLPPLFTGDTEDYTRATAQESKEIAEEQVFGPEKMDFDFIMNHKIFPELEIKYYLFHTKSAPVENRKELAELIVLLSQAGMTAGETRRMMDGITDIEMDKLDANDPENKWLNSPMSIAQFVMSMALKMQMNDTDTDATPEEKAQKFVNSLNQNLELVKKALKNRVSA